MAQRICFLGRGGSGKSTVAQNLGHALALKGYHVLLVGNDISLSSTVLLRRSENQGESFAEQFLQRLPSSSLRLPRKPIFSPQMLQYFLSNSPICFDLLYVCFS